MHREVSPSPRPSSAERGRTACCVLVNGSMPAAPGRQNFPKLSNGDPLSQRERVRVRESTAPRPDATVLIKPLLSAVSCWLADVPLTGDCSEKRIPLVCHRCRCTPFSGVACVKRPDLLSGLSLFITPPEDRIVGREPLDCSFAASSPARRHKHAGNP